MTAAGGLYAAVAEVAASRPDAEAVRTTDGEQVAYRELLARADRIAAGLHRRGIGHGSTVAVCLANGIGYVALILAAARTGARYVPLLANFDARDIRTALERARPDLVVLDGHRTIATDGLPVAGLSALEATVPAATGERPDTAALPATAELPAAAPGSSVFRMLWTSGSTGFPKAMTWRQDKFVTERRRWLADTGIRDSDVFFCRHTLDVAHATDLHVFAALLSGARLVLADPHAPAATLLAQLAAQRATVMSALPDHYAALVRAAADVPAGQRLDLGRLRLPLCGGAYLGTDVVAGAADVLRIRIREIYGSTEFGLAMGNASDTKSETEAGSGTGRPARPPRTPSGLSPVAGVGVRLEPLHPAAPDLGELVLISDCTSEGYLDDGPANARTFRPGEFWTGDVARRTPDGRYRVLGRVTEALAATHGPLCAPILEEEIAASSAVAGAICLAARPQEYTDETLVAVRTAPGHTARDAAKAVEEVLAAHGLRGSVRHVGEFPLTPVGKIDKPRLRALWQTAGDRS